MSRNPQTAAGRALAEYTGDVAGVLAIEDEAARLTVERVREVLRQQGYTALVALFDDLATADVDEEPKP